MIQEKQKWKELTKNHPPPFLKPRVCELEPWEPKRRRSVVEKTQEQNQTPLQGRKYRPRLCWKQLNADAIGWGWRRLFYNSLEDEFNNYIALSTTESSTTMRGSVMLSPIWNIGKNRKTGRKFLWVLKIDGTKPYLAQVLFIFIYLFIYF